MKSALKKLRTKPITLADLPAIAKEIEEGSDRSAALIAGAEIENCLHTLILSRIRPLTNEQHTELFGPNRPLGSFSANILVGYAFHIFGPRTKYDLDLMREIRNTFAHAPTVIGFDTSEISAATERFKCLEGDDSEKLKEARSRFIRAHHFLAYHLLGEVDRPRTRMVVTTLD